LGIPLNHLMDNLKTLPNKRPLLVYCGAATGRPSLPAYCSAADLILFCELAEGIAAWEAGKLSVRSAQA
jgi:hypothetical protein